MRSLTPLLATALLAACAAPPRCPEAPPRVAASSAPEARVAPPVTLPVPRITISIRPEPGAPAVDVEISAVAADPAALAVFSISPPGGATALHIKSLRDDAGTMTAEPALRADGRVAITLPRKAAGEVRITYAIDAAPRPDATVPGVDPDVNRFMAAGEPLLLLPDGLDDARVHAFISITADRYGINHEHDRHLVDGASSFGVGATREVSVAGRELRGGVYLAGALGRALFDAAEGHDEAAWLGYTSFDPRPIAADVAAFRTAARELFRGGDEQPLALLIVPDARPPGAFAAARRARSVIVRLGAGETWTGPVRIAVATEVLRAWIGGRLWVGPDDPAHEAEAYWFTEGLTRQLARDLLFRFGLVTTRELLDEVHGLAGLAATSKRRADRNEALAARAKDPGVVPLLVARGALYATSVHARIRAKSRGKHGIEDILRPLFQKSREARGALPVSAWIQAVSAELGAPEDAVFARAIGEGRVDDLPDDALGPCFRRVKRTYEAFDLGFDEDATRASTDRKLANLRPGGPAERAGLAAGDVLLDALIGRGRGDVPVTITVERAREKKTFKYLPAGGKAQGVGFARKGDVPEDACAR